MASDKWKKIIVIALLVFTLLLFLVGFFMGFQSFFAFFRGIIVGLMILAMLFGLLYVFYLVFIKKEYKDIPAQFRKKLQQVSKVMDNKMLGNLYLSGDFKHNRINLGNYFYLRLNLPKIEHEKDKDKTHESSKTKAVPVDCFIVQKQKSIMDKFFGETFFILVRPQDHNYSAIFNDVVINGFNLIPLDNQFYTIDRRNLDLDMVKGLELNYIREVVFDIFTDLDKLVKQAMNLDQQFQKDKEKSREFELPQIGNFGGGGGGGS